MAWCPNCYFHFSHGDVVEGKCIYCWMKEAKRFQHELEKALDEDCRTEKQSVEKDSKQTQ